MKSITIKDMNGEKMIRVFHNGEGEYFVERLSTLPPFTVVIVLENNERITIHSAKKAKKKTVSL
jgi:hypothetical protein